jgi:hypothetical protein
MKDGKHPRHSSTLAIILLICGEHEDENRPCSSFELACSTPFIIVSIILVIPSLPLSIISNNPYLPFLLTDGLPNYFKFMSIVMTQ